MIGIINHVKVRMFKEASLGTVNKGDVKKDYEERISVYRRNKED